MEHSGLHIALAAERLGSFFGIPLTNTLLSAWLVMFTLIALAIIVGRNPRLIPGPMQNAFEALFEFVLKYMEDTLGNRKLAERFFPLIATIFLFIFMSNLFSFLPFFGSVGIFENGELVPLFRPVNTDLNVTLALAIMAYLVIEITGIVVLGFLKYGSKFVNFKGGAIGFVVGVMEFISNVSRLISFSFRLFGNVFAGEVLIAVVVLFLPYIVPVPVLLFETFVGLVQAAVFALLTLVFIKLAISEPHEAH
jgi:F-type H+-transporting ATPase subunit a